LFLLACGAARRRARCRRPSAASRAAPSARDAPRQRRLDELQVKGAVYVTTPDGTTRRVRAYGATRGEAADKLIEKLSDITPTPLTPRTRR
jgi:hypothetical protein